MLCVRVCRGQISADDFRRALDLGAWNMRCEVGLRPPRGMDFCIFGVIRPKGMSRLILLGNGRGCAYQVSV